ncbi:MAG: SUMF1/EgtB/PvdO family nonheme iron enzyme [Pseudomonadota bacterium]
MTTILVSHSRTDNAIVDQLLDWMKTNGFTDFFVERGEQAADFNSALRTTTGPCCICVFVVTKAWLSSEKGVREFRSASYRGIRALPLRLVDEPGEDPAATVRWVEIASEVQGVDLTPIVDGASIRFERSAKTVETLRRALRAAGALVEVGLDPRAFEIDAEKQPSPFPGLASFGDDDADAALFYGRSTDIAEVLRKLRQSRSTGDRRPLMILGASGSGKSSLLKAGVVPRLRREAPGWAPIRVFRPGVDPMLSFAEALSRTLADHRIEESPDRLRLTLLDAWRAADDATPLGEQGERPPAFWRILRTRLDEVGARIRGASRRATATLLLGVDQAEELARADGESFDAFCDYVRATLEGGDAALESSDGELESRRDVKWQVVFTIRSDSLPELLGDPRLRGLEKDGLTLRALPAYRFDDVVEGPAKRYGVEIEPALVAKLKEDAPDSDALPLLAFALERLWRGFAAAGRITLRDYENLGGMSVMIERAAERALSGALAGDDGPRQKPPKAVLDLCAAIFVPGLAQFNDEGEATKRVAAWSEFSEEAQLLLQRFIDWRLVTRKGGEAAGGDTVEVAHEALFREWQLLKGWLEPEKARLRALRGVQVASKLWENNTRSAADLTHFGKRLADAQSLLGLDRYRKLLTQSDRAYIGDCAAVERRKTRRRQALLATSAGLGVSLVLGSVVFAFQQELRREYTRLFEFAPFVKTMEDLAGLDDLASFRDCAEPALCPELVVLPEGRFLMGSEEGVGEDDERPRRDVSIARFAVGRFEITHDHWRACAAATGRQLVTQLEVDAGDAAAPYGCGAVGDSGFGRGDRPAINLSWYDAQGYIAWLNDMVAGDPEHGPYRLMSEAEWEYAARGGTETAFHWGDDVEKICDFANVANKDTKAKYALEWDVADCVSNFLETSPIGSFAPNAFGLYDMHGNVWEWVADCWHVSYLGAPHTQTAWLDADNGDCSMAVFRGGSWRIAIANLRSANREKDDRFYRNNLVGLRVARSLE